MITEIMMYRCLCDGCGEQWEDEDRGIMSFDDKCYTESEVMEDEEWHIDDESTPHKHYCPNCWTTDENENIVLTKC